MSKRLPKEKFIKNKQLKEALRHKKTNNQGVGDIEPRNKEVPYLYDPVNEAMAFVTAFCMKSYMSKGWGKRGGRIKG